MPNSKNPSALLHAQRGSTVFGFIIGLFVGLIVAVIVAFFAADIRFAGSDKLTQPLSKSKEPETSVLSSGTFNPNEALLPQQETTADDLSVIMQQPPDTGTVISDQWQVEAPKVEAVKAIESEVEQVELPVSTTPKKPAPTSAAASPGYYVQAGAFRSQADAQTQRAKLAFLGEKGVVSHHNNGTAEVYRVRLGPFSTRAQAEKGRDNLQKAGIEAVIIAIH